MSNSVLPKFSLDQIKMSDNVVMVGGPASDKTALGIQLLTKKMKYGVKEGWVAAGSKNQVTQYKNALSKVNSDHQVVVGSRIHRETLLKFINEAVEKKGNCPKRFVLIDSLVLKETNLPLLEQIIDKGLNILLVFLANSTYDVPALFRHKFNYVLVDKYPVGRAPHLADLLKNSAAHKLKMTELVKNYQNHGILVLDNHEKVKDLEKENKVMLKC